ncbi:MAG: Pls/PosA family non-ribosomal peptide synthetase [Bacteroidales bacterium]
MYKIDEKQYISKNHQPVEISAKKNENGLPFCYEGDYDSFLAEDGYLHRLFEDTVKKYPERIAVQFNNETITYAGLNRKANRLARYLKSMGVGANDIAGIFLSRTPDMYIAILGILKAGAAYIPIDPKYPAERVHYILNNCNAKALITNSGCIYSLKGLNCIEILLDKDLDKLNIQSSINISENEIDSGSGDTAYAIYTSGTTGVPKGVKISHRAACNLVRSEGKIFGIKPEDKVFQGFSIAFDASVEEIWMAFYSGASVFIGTEDIMQSGPGLSKILNENKVTVLSTVPTLLSMLTEDIPLLRLLILGGEVCPSELVKRWATPGRRMINTYGPTETTVIATYSECSPMRDVTIGKPIPNYSAYILDSNMQRVPISVPGELCIGGMGLSDGYINLPELTDKNFIVPRFKTNPYFPKRLYRTGDLCRFNECGEIEFLGRIDSQIKLRGFRIELTEIESQLMRCTGVQSAAVTVKNGFNGIQLLVAYIIPTNPGIFDQEIAKNQLRSRLAPFMIPNIFEIVTEFPLMSSGKVDRTKLPEPKFINNDQHMVNPVDCTPNELKILHLWKKLFAPNKVSVEDNFFDLGGHSLFASQMISELRKESQMNMLSVRDIYDYPTVRKLAAYIDAANRNNVFKETERSRKSKVNLLTYYLIAALQILSFFFFYGIATLLIITPFLIKHYFPLISQSSFVLQCLAVIVLSYPFILLLSVIIKWIVIGKFREGVYPLWGLYYFRFWFVKKCVDISQVSILTGTPFIALYCRLMGMKIGKDVYLGSDRIRVFDLVSVGDNSSISKEAYLMGYIVEDGMLKLGKISVGNNCFLGARSLLNINSCMEDNSALLELSMLPDNGIIPAGQTWRGSPAKPSENEYGILAEAKKKSPHHIRVAKKIGLTVVHAIALIFLILLPWILLIPYSLVIYFSNIQEGIWMTIITIVPLSALFIITFCLCTAALKWIVLGKLKPGDIPVNSILYIRKWFVDSLIAMSILMVKSLYATLYLPPWLRLAGAKIGKRAEISTVNYISTDLLNIGHESFLADSVNVGPPVVVNGNMLFRTTTVGIRSFLGNSSVLPPGSKVEDGCLIGVLSITPSLPEEAKMKQASWLGSPPMFLPNRQKSPEFPEKYTFKPTFFLYLMRGIIEFFKITMPFAIASILIFIFYNYSYILFKPGNYLRFIFEAPIALFLLSISTIFFGWFFKTALIGKYKTDAKPLWSTFVWRNEFINSISENLVYPFFEFIFLGTPFAPVYFRIMGCKIGKKVFMETTEITEFDLVTIGNESALNYGCTIQTHLFEDRVMKMSDVNIGKTCTIGPLSVILYDTKMHDHSLLQGLSLIMKGETLPENTHWHGSPCQLQK